MARKKNEDIWVFGNFVFDRRNELFHQLRGLRSEEVFKNWQSPDETQCEHDPEGKWKTRILNCLNFIAKEDLPKEFESPEDASLMAQVHCELEKSLANL
nr:MAG: hypothetical protein EDM05_11570 [Leptolyngbya sp. IPPAS B-1204]